MSLQTSGSYINNHGWLNIHLKISCYQKYEITHNSNTIVKYIFPGYNNNLPLTKQIILFQKKKNLLVLISQREKAVIKSALGANINIG